MDNLNTICLVLFAKNDDKYILELLNSVLPLIDYYYIYDLSDTDNLQDIIKCHFKDKVDGRVIKVNDSQLINSIDTILSDTRKVATYTLLLNTDCIVEISSDFKKEQLCHDVYRIECKIDNYIDYRVGLIKNNLNIKWLGIQDFCIDYPFKQTLNKLNTLTITDRRFSSTREYKRNCEVKLYKYEYLSNPSKTYFKLYFANCYKELFTLTNDKKYIGKSIKWFQRCVSTSQWDEEIYTALVNLGILYKFQNKDERSSYHYLEAYLVNPKRIEALYELINYYRDKDKKYSHIANLFYKTATKLEHPENCYLSIRKDVYTYLLEYEHSIIAFYNHEQLDAEFLYKYFNIIGNGIYNNVISNYKFYVKFLSSISYTKLMFEGAQTLENYSNEFIASTPSIVPYNNGYLLNMRYVNYTLNDNGAYTYNYPITNINRKFQLDNGLNIISDEVFKTDLIKNRRCGIEELKLFNYNNQVLFTGIEYSKLSRKKFLCRGVYLSSNNKLPSFNVSLSNGGISKWCLLSGKNELNVITTWYPLIINTINENMNDIIKSITYQDVPLFFKYLFGSTNGFTYDDEIWILTHMIDFSTNRIYYFCVIILDALTLKYKRHSILFKFENRGIEQVYGMIVEKERIIFSYSNFEKNACLYIWERPKVDQFLFSKIC